MYSIRLFIGSKQILKNMKKFLAHLRVIYYIINVRINKDYFPPFLFLAQQLNSSFSFTIHVAPIFVSLLFIWSEIDLFRKNPLTITISYRGIFMIILKDKKKIIEETKDIEKEKEEETEVDYEEYENLFFTPSEEEIEEAIEIAHLLYLTDKY